MQTPHGKNKLGLEPGTLGCEETVLSNTTQCSPSEGKKRKKKGRKKRGRDISS